MLTVTRDMILPTTITGSYPRPLWFDRSLAGRSFKEAMGDSLFREQYLDAVSSIIGEQEAAGLDIVTDGDSRFDLTVGGKSWFFYVIERLGGIHGHRDTSRGWMSRHGLRPGKILWEVQEAYQPAVVRGKLTRGPLEYTALWQVAQRMSNRPVKFGTICAPALAGMLWDEHYKDDDALILDLCDIMNAEFREMADAGVKRALAFVTSAYSSYSGCRQYRENIAAAREAVGPRAPEVDKIRVFFNHPGFVEPMAANVRAALEGFPADVRSTVPVLFTAHSIPTSMADGCRYVAQLEESCRLVADRAAATDWKLVFQSRSGPPTQPWLEPDVCDAIRELHAAAYHRHARAGIARGDPRGSPQDHGDDSLGHGAGHAVAHSRQMATGNMAGFVGDDADHLAGMRGPDQQSRIHEQVEAVGDESVQRAVIDQVHADRRRVEPRRREKWRCIDADGIFDLGVADEADALRDRRRRRHQQRRERADHSGAPAFSHHAQDQAPGHCRLSPSPLHK